MPRRKRNSRARSAFITLVALAVLATAAGFGHLGSSEYLHRDGHHTADLLSKVSGQNHAHYLPVEVYSGHAAILDHAVDHVDHSQTVGTLSPAGHDHTHYRHG